MATARIADEDVKAEEEPGQKASVVVAARVARSVAKRRSGIVIITMVVLYLLARVLSRGRGGGTELL